MNTRIDDCFARLRARGEKAFIAYLTAGDPSLDETEARVLALEAAGVDIVELGIPFSDPLADGRVNQESAQRALTAGTTLTGVLDLVARIRRRSQLPLLCYTYMNPVHAHGVEPVAKKAARAGLDGLLMLDLPAEEAGPYADALEHNGLNLIALVTPTTPDARIRKIVRRASGFVYAVSREGVTGVQQELGPSARDLLLRTKRLTSLPVALGFGIATPAHARAAAQDADGIVVGSAIVQRFHEEPASEKGRRAAARFAATLVTAAKDDA